MSTLEPREICELITVEDDTDFRAFNDTNPTDLMFFPEEYGENKELVLMPEAGDFAKWLGRYDPKIKVYVKESSKRLILRANDFWFALAYLGNDVALPVYLNLVANYLYDKLRGALKGETETTRVHMSVVYKDEKTEAIKQFNFEGSVEAFEKAVKKIDINKFFDE